ncbi:nucleotidyltransferase family protein [Arthrobacter humicola]
MQNPADKTQLSIPEAVLLGHALVQRVADSLGIRAFFIKGPASVVQGLRLPKMSVDVDVFVNPADLEALLGGLRQRGWRERPVDPDERSFPRHSTTIDHPSWPCCIDVHFRFPGMEAAPGDSFDVMWAHTEDLELAGQEVRVPSKALGILILALHALRSTHLPACRQELDFLAELTEQEDHTPAIVDISTATSSLAAMRPFLEDLGSQPEQGAWPDASTEWRNRLLAKEPGSARIIAIAQAPLREKLDILSRAIFPPADSFLNSNIYADLSYAGLLKLHRARWARFLRSLPKIVKDLSPLRRRGPAAKSAGQPRR